MPSYDFTQLQQGRQSGAGWSGIPTLGTNLTGGFRWEGSAGKLWTSLAVTIEDTLVTGGTGTATIYVVELGRVGEFSSSYLPATLPQTLVGTATGTPADPGGLVVPLSFHSTAGQATRLRPAVTGATPFAILISWSGSNFIAGVTLAGQYSGSDFTGLQGPWRAEGRADHCPRCGQPSTRDTWVRDGYADGLRVCPACYDPPDEVGRHVRIGTEKAPVGED